MSCFICCSAVAQSQILKCVRCDYACCKDCISKWMRESRATSPNPECNLPLSRELLTDTFPRLVPVLVEKQKSDLLEAEKARMTGVLREVEAYRKYRQMKAEEPQLVKKRKDLETELVQVKRTLRQITTCNEAWKNDDFVHFVRAANGECDQYGRPTPREKGAEEDVAPKVLCPCPKTGCQGFVLRCPKDKAYGKCAVCDTFVCAACLCQTPAPVESDPQVAHACLPEDLASAEAIRKESKPCPKCGTRISKVSGCDQMFCVACRTAFSWSSGRIERGPIHNPEYFRLRQRMREAGMPIPEDADDADDEPQQAAGQQAQAQAQACGRVFVQRFQGQQRVCRAMIQRFTEKFQAVFGSDVDKCEPFVFALEALRFMSHLLHTDRITQEPERKDNTKYLIQFMVGELDQKQLQSKIMQREKHVQHQSDLKAVHDIFFETGNHLLETLFDAPEVSLAMLESFRAQMMNLMEMCNERLAKISKVYGNRQHAYHVDSSVLPPQVWTVTMFYD